MKCPYCNKTLKSMLFTDTYTCTNAECKQSSGMLGTQPMWKKVASLAKIRNASKKYSNKPEAIEKRKEYMAQKYETDPKYKEMVLINGRKWREANKDKVAERNKKYREAHREYYREYGRNYYARTKEKKTESRTKG